MGATIAPRVHGTTGRIWGGVKTSVPRKQSLGVSRRTSHPGWTHLHGRARHPPSPSFGRLGSGCNRMPWHGWGYVLPLPWKGQLLHRGRIPWYGGSIAGRPGLNIVGYAVAVHLDVGGRMAPQQHPVLAAGVAGRNRWDCGGHQPCFTLSEIGNVL